MAHWVKWHQFKSRHLHCQCSSLLTCLEEKHNTVQMFVPSDPRGRPSCISWPVPGPGNTQKTHQQDTPKDSTGSHMVLSSTQDKGPRCWPSRGCVSQAWSLLLRRSPHCKKNEYGNQSCRCTPLLAARSSMSAISFASYFQIPSEGAQACTYRLVQKLPPQTYTGLPSWTTQGSWKALPQTSFLLGKDLWSPSCYFLC